MNFLPDVQSLIWNVVRANTCAANISYIISYHGNSLWYENCSVPIINCLIIMNALSYLCPVEILSAVAEYSLSSSETWKCDINGCKSTCFKRSNFYLSDKWSQFIVCITCFQVHHLLSSTGQGIARRFLGAALQCIHFSDHSSDSNLEKQLAN